MFQRPGGESAVTNDGVVMWALGFWEEVDLPEIPPGQRSPTQTPGHYGAYRTGNQILIMTDFVGGSATLELPGPASVSATRRRIYDEQSGRWRPLGPLPGLPIGRPTTTKPASFEHLEPLLSVCATR